MKLTFLGTRGYIDLKTRRHRRHTALLVSYRGRRVMIDCGEDWLGKLDDVKPQAIVVTHGHPDHVGGLQDGAPCPVYATPEGWNILSDFPIGQAGTLRARKPKLIEGIAFEAFPVEHSVRAPAVGYRIVAGRAAVFYCPDLVYIHERREALEGVRLYVGDGATVTRSLVRKSGDRLIGHSPVPTQLTWCQKERVSKAIFTHCGSEIVGGDERTLGPRIARMARARGVEARIAYDGLEIVLR